MTNKIEQLNILGQKYYAVSNNDDDMMIICRSKKKILNNAAKIKDLFNDTDNNYQENQVNFNEIEMTNFSDLFEPRDYIRYDNLKFGVYFCAIAAIQYFSHQFYKRLV